MSYQFKGGNIKCKNFTLRLEEGTKIFRRFSSCKKKVIERAINTKKSQKESLQTEIENLEKELETLSQFNTKRKGLENKLKEKKGILRDTETILQTLEDQKPDKISFPLREGFSARLNPNGTRTIKINDLNFSIQLPKNRLFMSRKNILGINLAFVYRVFALNGMESIFAPKLESGAIPDKKNRLFGRNILKQLGFPTNIILSQSNILQLQKDLSKLKQKGVARTGMEDLARLEIWDITKQEIKTNRLNSCLQFIRQHRGYDLDFQKL